MFRYATPDFKALDSGGEARQTEYSDRQRGVPWDSKNGEHFFLTPVSLFAGAFIVGHTHTRPGLRGESGLVSLLGEKSTV